MSPTEIYPHLWRIQLPMPRSYMRFVNLYLIRDADGYALVDCGLPNDESWQALGEQLGTLSVPLEALHTVVVTHGHSDHAGLSPRLRDASGAQVWLGQDDVTFMRYHYLEIDQYREMLRVWLERYGAPPSEAAELVGGLDELGHPDGVPNPDRLLQGGEELAVGPYRFEVLATPGHTPGHVCLYEPRHKLFLSGDHVLRHVHPNVSLRPYSTENPLVGYLRSLRHIADLDVDLGLPGHGEPFAELAERARELEAHQMERRQRVLALLGRKPQTAYELAAEVWADSTPLNWAQFGSHLRRNAIGTLVAHLELLAEEGLIQRDEEDDIATFRRA